MAGRLPNRAKYWHFLARGRGSSWQHNRRHDWKLWKNDQNKWIPLFEGISCRWRLLIIHPQILGMYPFWVFLKAYVCVLQIWGRTKSWVYKFYFSIYFVLQEHNIHCCLSFFFLFFSYSKVSFGYRVWEQYVVKHGWKLEIMQILEISAIVRTCLPNYRGGIGPSTSPDNFSEES